MVQGPVVYAVLVSLFLTCQSSRAKGIRKYPRLSIPGIVDSTGLSFAHYIYGDSCRFENIACFDSIQANGEAGFSSATFLDEVSFTNAMFLEGAYFDCDTFAREASFNYTVFKNEVNFGNSFFKRRAPAIFTATRFGSAANFENVTFGTDAYFWQDTFQQKVNFNEAAFKGSAEFWRAQFADSVIFTGASFAGRTNFERARLPRYLDLSKVSEIGSEIDLSDAMPPEEGACCTVRLVGSDISKIRLRYRYFQLDTADVSTEQMCGIYENLLDKLKKDGYQESYEKLAVEYSAFQYTSKKEFLSNVLNFADCAWWNYGFSRTRILLWTFIFIVLYTAIVYPKIEYLSENTYAVPFMGKKIRGVRESHRRRHLALYSLIYVCVLFFGIKMDLDGLKNPTGWTFFILSIYVVGLVCTGFIVSFILQINVLHF